MPDSSILGLRLSLHDMAGIEEDDFRGRPPITGNRAGGCVLTVLAEGPDGIEVEGVALVQGFELAYRLVCTRLAAVHAVKRIPQAGTSRFELVLVLNHQRQAASLGAFDLECRFVIGWRRTRCENKDCHKQKCGRTTIHVDIVSPHPLVAYPRPYPAIWAGVCADMGVCCVYVAPLVQSLVA